MRIYPSVVLGFISGLLAFPAFAAMRTSTSAIEHVIIVVQENHSFDSYFGRYCKARTGSHPTCETGPECCEAGPDRNPGTGNKPLLLDDALNQSRDPNHYAWCESKEINGGAMNGYSNIFIGGLFCADGKNFAYASGETAKTYWQLASQSSLADRYFQPIVGASSSNDMYLARAQYVFTDDSVGTNSIGSQCGEINHHPKTYNDQTIADFLNAKNVSWAYYAEGYDVMVAAHSKGTCPKTPPECGAGIDAYPCIYDPTDNPFEYYKNTIDNPLFEKDFADFSKSLEGKTLPAVSFIKGLGFRTEHPGSTISVGQAFVQGVVDSVLHSSYAKNTLILVTPDESGGFFDHVAPPMESLIDFQPYGPRIPLLAIGYFAKPNSISHVQMEHSSIVKFIEWNWLGQTGQLGGRDLIVNNIGSLLDPEKTEIQVPSN
jgi:phospholipase C